jgi:hypothetical protein
MSLSSMRIIRSGVNHERTGDILIKPIGDMLSMKWLVVVLILIICQGFAQGYPIYAANKVVNCTIFGAFKDNYIIVEPNENRNIVLNVDVSLVKSNATGIAPVQATYFLVDRNDKTYPTRDEFTRSLGPGRHLLGFAILPETIPKILIVVPSGSPQGGNRLVINFGELTNATNGKVNLLYYGVLNSKSESNLKSIDFDMSVTNSGTKELSLSSKNFSLIDQRGWRYDSLAHNNFTNDGFPSRDLKPKETARIKVSFGSMSPLSRPSRLIYEYSNTSSIVLNIDSEEICSCQKCGDSAAELPALTSAPEPSVLTRLAGSLNATRAVLLKGKEDFLKNNVRIVGGNGTRQKAVLGK